VTATGETAGSQEATLIVAANELLSIASPGTDEAGIATGWNVYVGTASGQEMKQNATPIGLANAWTEPTTGLLPAPNGTKVPNFILAIDNVPNVNAPGVNPNSPSGPNNPIGAPPTILIEGVDFIADAKRGQLTRLFSDGYPKRWPALPIVVIYPAGFATIPASVQLAAIRLIRSEYFGQARDPKIREEEITGAYRATYWFANGPGEGNFPPDVCNLLDMHRMPVIG